VSITLALLIILAVPKTHNVVLVMSVIMLPIHANLVEVLLAVHQIRIVEAVVVALPLAMEPDLVSILINVV
jgi:hypothetical protein